MRSGAALPRPGSFAAVGGKPPGNSCFRPYAIGMERRFDATLKSLLEDDPADWPRLLGVNDPHVRVIDADISTISGAADKVLRLQGPPPSILHLEFQSGPDASLPC